jgi:pimeloyl-ACP methyl ester carboxylesterase
MSMTRRLVSPLLFSFVTLLGFGAPSTAEARPAECRHDEVEVDRVSFPIVLSNGAPAQITAYYYHQRTPRDRILQVAVHGATHYHIYWDLPTINGIDYSYARYMAERGYDVLAIDQLGTGESSQPDGDFLDLDEVARGLHQVLANLRSPHNPTGKRHNRIGLIGHSNGSLTSVYATGTYNDADALVTTAFMVTPHPYPFGLPELGPLLFAPYFDVVNTLPEQFWIDTFYYVPSMDRALVDYEWAHLGPALQPRAAFIDLFTTGRTPAGTRAAGVHVPVLVQNGDFDSGQSSQYMAPEPTYYPSAPSVSLTYLTNIGHHVNGHKNHAQSWEAIDDFLTDKLGHGHSGR